jgi:cytochrome P450
VLTQPEHIQAVFKDSDKHVKATDNNSGYLLSQLLGSCLGLISGSQWRSVRSATEKAFTRAASAKYVNLIQDRTRRHLLELQSNPTFRSGLLDPAGHLKMLPFLVVAEIIYGPLNLEMESQLLKLAPLRENLFKHVIAGGLARFSISKIFSWTVPNRALKTFLKQWHAFNDSAQERAVREDIDAPIVHMYAALDSGSITRDQLHQTLDEMLYANLDVTLGGLSWNVVFLASSPQAQALLRAEIEQAQSNIEKYLLSSSTLLSACVSESARLRPLAAFSVPQALPHPVTLTSSSPNGKSHTYTFPPNTNFIISAYALNIRNSFWGATASERETYWPQRWLTRQKEGKMTELRYHYWRFGFGPRQCLGRYVADIVIRSLLVELITAWDLETLVEDKEAKWERDGETWINHPKMIVKCLKREGKESITA